MSVQSSQWLTFTFHKYYMNIRGSSRPTHILPLHLTHVSPADIQLLSSIRLDVCLCPWQWCQALCHPRHVFESKVCHIQHLPRLLRSETMQKQTEILQLYVGCPKLKEADISQLLILFDYCCQALILWIHICVWWLCNPTWICTVNNREEKTEMGERKNNSVSWIHNSRRRAPCSVGWDSGIMRRKWSPPRAFLWATQMKPALWSFPHIPCGQVTYAGMGTNPQTKQWPTVHTI